MSKRTNDGSNGVQKPFVKPRSNNKRQEPTWFEHAMESIGNPKGDDRSKFDAWPSLGAPGQNSGVGNLPTGDRNAISAERLSVLSLGSSFLKKRKEQPWTVHRFRVGDGAGVKARGEEGRHKADDSPLSARRHSNNADQPKRGTAGQDHFQKPQVDLNGKNIIAVFTSYNELQRIDYFLAHYRRMGVKHFFAIDNNSTDGSAEFLQKQPDLTYFHTTESYVESKAGRLWTSEIAAHYGENRWVLTVDLDELLVFPGSEYITLQELCQYLDEGGYEGIFTIFLDMYARGPLDTAVYRRGQPFLDVCDHFDTASYTLTQPMNFPHVGIFGGPRQRIFWDSGNRGKGPSMRKLPLVKWRKNFRYLYSTHSSVPIPLADVTGALLHFKFFASFKEFANREVERGDRVQMGDYEHYARKANDGSISFLNESSVKFESSNTLVEQGIVVTTNKFINWLRPRLIALHGDEKARTIDKDIRSASKTAVANAALNIKHLPLVWPLLATSSDGGILAVNKNRVLGWFIDRSGKNFSKEILVHKENDLIASGTANFDLGEFSSVHPDHKGNLFVIDIPTDALDEKGGTRVLFSSSHSVSPFASALVYKNGNVNQSDEYQGALSLETGERLKGWAWSSKDPDYGIAVTLFIDGVYWRKITANKYDDNLRESGVGDGEHAFSIELPDNLDRSLPRMVEATVVGTNLALKGSPCMVPARNNKGKLIGGDGAGADAPRAVLVPFAIAGGLRGKKGIYGEIYCSRRGRIYGWAADLNNTARPLTIEVEAGGQITSVPANKPLLVSSHVSDKIKNHGFEISWDALKSAKGNPSDVRVRVLNGGFAFTEDIIALHPDTTLSKLGFEGYVDRRQDGCVSGWVWNREASERINVSIFVDGQFIGSMVAADYREDLLHAGIGDGFHSFCQKLPKDLRDGTRRTLEVVLQKEGVPISNDQLEIVNNLVGPIKPRTAVAKARVATGKFLRGLSVNRLGR